MTGKLLGAFSREDDHWQPNLEQNFIVRTRSDTLVPVFYSGKKKKKEQRVRIKASGRHDLS